jgi:hypothetical protein
VNDPVIKHPRGKALVPVEALTNNRWVSKGLKRESPPEEGALIRKGL